MSAVTCGAMRNYRASLSDTSCREAINRREEWLRVKQTGGFVEVFPARAGMRGIAPQAWPARAPSEIASAIRHFENGKSDSRTASNRLQKRDHVVE
ncbi:hypothetical protein [Burkholderia sp. BCC1988]|uniref:hypothetical protein n=1 Tax=Burkholderia sp. BCC1988 TaxID=2817443 RepID=UPI002AAFB1F4|nr:hypothetical protein [Burkholderia sp. BCC1988]